MQRQNSVLRSVHVTSQWRLYPGGKLALSMAYPGGKLAPPLLNALSLSAPSGRHISPTAPIRSPQAAPPSLRARERQCRECEIRCT